MWNTFLENEKKSNNFPMRHIPSTTLNHFLTQAINQNIFTSSFKFPFQPDLSLQNRVQVATALPTIMERNFLRWVFFPLPPNRFSPSWRWCENFYSPSGAKKPLNNNFPSFLSCRQGLLWGLQDWLGNRLHKSTMFNRCLLFWISGMCQDGKSFSFASDLEWQSCVCF
jgi:hypothetical protein